MKLKIIVVWGDLNCRKNKVEKREDRTCYRQDI